MRTESPDRPTFPQSACSPGGLVTAPHWLATQAGVDVLRAGGSAVDAAIAASAVLCVAYPHMTGLGGDAFWMLYDARRHEVRCLNAAGRAAAAATPEAYRQRGLDAIPVRGWLAVPTAPGLVAGWVEAHRAYGRRPLRELLGPAIQHAREGVPVTPALAWWFDGAREALAATSEARALFLPGGEPPRPGQRLRNPDLARTLEAVAADGWAGFYAGEVAAEIARASRAGGGLLTADDLARTRAAWTAPLRGRYRDLTLYQTPPPTQGLTALQILGLVEEDDLKTLGFQSAATVHLLVEAKKLAFADRQRYLADPDFAPVPVDALLDRAYLRRRRALLDPDRARPPAAAPPGAPSLEGDTAALAVVDTDGNAACLIQSLYFGFGAGVVAGRTGVLLHNRGAAFSLDPAHPNRLEPGKQPAHTLIASLAFGGERLRWVFATMGADGQPQIHAQVYTALVDFGLDLRTAIEAPRWLAGRFGVGEPDERLYLEGRFPAETLAGLEARGHALTVCEPFWQRAGHAHGIEIEPVTGARFGAADPRADGAALAA